MYIYILEYVSEIVKDVCQYYWPISLCNQRNTVSRLLTVCGLWPWNRMELNGHRGIKLWGWCSSYY